jgi:XTP/dITP diphosphohydrolase
MPATDLRVRFVVATRNAHKIQEIQTILGDGFEVRSLADFPGAPDVVEDAGTFAGNATKKAVSIANWLSHLPAAGSSQRPERTFVLADDSGLEVDALNGAPGVHSARFAALDTEQRGNSSTHDNNAKLLRLLANVAAEKRTARFRCVLALAPVPAEGTCRETASPVCLADETELQAEVFDGVCEGRIGFEAKGQGGFGYDPLFYPAGYDQSFAELGEAVKNQFSHRARALAKLKRKWSSGVLE